VDEAIAPALRRACEARGAHFLNDAEIALLAKELVTAQRLPNPALVGKSAGYIAEQVGLKVPPQTRVLIAPLAGVGRDYPLSIEKLAPILSWYVVKDWREGCERCIQILRYGGMGHTMSIHSKNEDVILQFGLKKPAFRICVNTPTTHGSIGLTTGLDPAMTLGCGGWGGNITSDNITPRHLLNIKRLAYEVRPAIVDVRSAVSPSDGSSRMKPAAPVALPKAPPRPVAVGISADALAERIDRFLASRGIAPSPGRASAERPAADRDRGETAGVVSPAAAAEIPAEFVCEEDVRAAIRTGRKLLVDDKTILTPSARDLGESHRVFIQAGWPP
jgi:acetaldehyde dehydrogenase (acetylating)